MPSGIRGVEEFRPLTTDFSIRIHASEPGGVGALQPAHVTIEIEASGVKEKAIMVLPTFSNEMDTALRETLPRELKGLTVALRMLIKHELRRSQEEFKKKGILWKW